MNSRLISGLAVILVGILFLLSNFHILYIGFFWPVFVLFPGLACGYLFLRDRKSYGYLMPFSILTLTGIIFFICEFSRWRNMEFLWPFFLISPGCGFFLMYFFGEKEKALLIPGFILSFLGLIFLAKTDIDSYILPIIFIIVGLWFLIFKKK